MYLCSFNMYLQCFLYVQSQAPHKLCNPQKYATILCARMHICASSYRYSPLALARLPLETFAFNALS